MAHRPPFFQRYAQLIEAMKVQRDLSAKYYGVADLDPVKHADLIARNDGIRDALTMLLREAGEE